MAIQNDTPLISYIKETGRVLTSGALGTAAGLTTAYFMSVAGVLVNVGLHQVNTHGSSQALNAIKQRVGHVVSAGFLLLTVAGVAYTSVKVGRSVSREVYDQLQ